MNETLEFRDVRSPTTTRRVAIVSAVASTVLVATVFALLIARHYRPIVSATLVDNGDGSIQLRFEQNHRVGTLYSAWISGSEDPAELLWQADSYRVSQASLGTRRYAAPVSLSEFRLHTGEPDDLGRMTRMPEVGEEFSIRAFYTQKTFGLGLAGKTVTFRFKRTSEGTIDSVGVSHEPAYR